MKKVAIYPVDMDNIFCLVNACNIMAIEEINSLIHLRGFVLNKRYEQYKKEFVGYFGDSIDEGLKNIDVLYLRESPFVTHEVYDEIFMIAGQRKIEVVIDKGFYLKLKKGEHIKNDKEVKVVFLNEDLSKNSILSKRTQVSNIPVITITSACELTENMEAGFSIKRHFCVNGYNVLHLCTNIEGNIWGSKLLPDFLFKNDICLRNKILMFNSYIMKKLREDMYDLVLINIEEPVLGLNKFKMYNYAESMQVISTALEIDENILCLNFMEDINEKFLKELSNSCKYRFNAETNYFWMSGNIVSYDEEREDEVDKMYMSKQFIEDKFPKHFKEIFNMVYGMGNLKIPDNIMQNMQTNFSIL